MKKLIPLLMTAAIALTAFTACATNDKTPNGSETAKPQKTEILVDVEPTGSEPPGPEASDPSALFKGALQHYIWFMSQDDKSPARSFQFKDGKVTVGTSSVKKGGSPEVKEETVPYQIGADQICIDLPEGKLEIPFQVKEKHLMLGQGNCITMEQVIDGLQGYWKIPDGKLPNELGDQPQQVICIKEDQISKGTASYETFTKEGESNYVAEAKGSYEILPGAFESELADAAHLSFVIKDGAALPCYDGEPMPVFFKNYKQYDEHLPTLP